METELTNIRKAIVTYCGDLLDRNEDMGSGCWACLSENEVDDLKSYIQRSQSNSGSFDLPINEIVTIQAIHLRSSFQGAATFLNTGEIMLFDVLSAHYKNDLSRRGRTAEADDLYALRYGGKYAL